MARTPGAKNKKPAQGRKTIFQSSSVSGSPEEIALLKTQAEKAGKSVSRYVLDWVLSQK